MEEFEEKIDKIAEGQDGGEDNWISKIYNQFSFFNEVDDTLTDADMDGLEPPLLDETWGLAVRNASVKSKRLFQPLVYHYLNYVLFKFYGHLKILAHLRAH